MSYRKYANDFRLEVQNRPGKKPKTITVYVGPRFAYLAEPDCLTSLRRYLPGTVFPAIACFILSLFFNCSLLRHYAVIIPYFCSFLAYCYLGASVCGFLYRKPPYTREQNDTIPRRIPICTIIPLIINCYTLIASVVYMIVAPEDIRLLWDVLFLILCAVQAVCLFLAFRRRSDLETYEVTEEG